MTPPTKQNPNINGGSIKLRSSFAMSVTMERAKELIEALDKEIGGD